MNSSKTRSSTIEQNRDSTPLQNRTWTKEARCCLMKLCLMIWSSCICRLEDQHNTFTNSKISIFFGRFYATVFCFSIKKITKTLKSEMMAFGGKERTRSHVCKIAFQGISQLSVSVLVNVTAYTNITFVSLVLWQWLNEYYSILPSGVSTVHPNVVLDVLHCLTVRMRTYLKLELEFQTNIKFWIRLWIRWRKRSSYKIM